MTRKEFYLKSIIAMAGNSAFAIEPRKLDYVAINENANNLLLIAGDEWPEAFDQPGERTRIIVDHEIDNALNAVSETLEAIKEVREQLWKD